AMANARPIIAATVGGVSDLLGHRISVGEAYAVCEHGLAVRPGDIKGFAGALAALIDAGEWREEMGERGRVFVMQNYSKERLLEDVSNLYRKLVGQSLKSAEIGRAHV